MTFIIMFLVGLYVGLLIGIVLGAYYPSRAQRPLIEDYKKYTDYWYNSYMKLLKDYKKMSLMYVKEAAKNTVK